MKRVLNVGGGDRATAIPPLYDGWEHVLLDINPDVKPDIVLDARQLSQLPAAQYDAVYCSHNLEHYHRHEGAAVLAGMRHVLKPEGFVNIIVPDLGAVLRTAVDKGLDIDDVLYVSPAGPILVRDVIFGYHVPIEQGHNPFYAHKTGFTEKSLGLMLHRCGFPYVFQSAGRNLELVVCAFPDRPAEWATKLLGLPPVPQA